MLSHKAEHLFISNGDFADSTGLNSACLKTLHLRCCRKVPPVSYWTLPSLTSLYLRNVRIGNEISGLENLKELTLVENFGKISCDKIVTINCPKLERLSLYTCFRHTYIVSAPSLLSLSYCSQHVSAFSAREGFPCVKHVYIDIKKKNGDFFDYSDWPNGTVGKREPAMRNIVSMLKAVSDTQGLGLSSDTVEVSLTFSFYSY